MSTTPTNDAVETDPRRARWEIVTLATMYVGYAAFMLCRNTVVAASPVLIEDPTLGLD
jgi:sugar phosphate permease